MEHEKVLDAEFNALVLDIASVIKYRAREHAPSTFLALKDEYQVNGDIVVSSLHSKNTIFGNQRINWAFRAWHDLCHILANADFTPAGERAAANLQTAMMRAWIKGYTQKAIAQRIWFARIIDAEVNGQVAYYFEHLTFPENQYEFTKSLLGV